MKRVLVAAAVVIFGSLFFFWLTNPPSKIKVGQLAPDFLLSDGQNEKVSLKNFSDKVVILNFWATWCPPCLAEMPSLEKLHRQLSSSGGVVVGVNHDSSNLLRSKEAVAGFVKRVPLSFPVLYDIESQASNLYGIYALPQTFIIGRDGRVLAVVSGAQDWTSSEFLDRITAALK
ncbi:MAG: TlpA disulfide reductase family protein [Deltaproteobacteria bacterium]|nr:TlpA disulfide reductase family protein [Deltaproteobacteria bacterium]